MAWKWLGGQRVTVMMPVGTAITAVDTPVKLASNKVAPAGDGETVWGVATTKAGTSDLVAVDISPTSRYQVTVASGVKLSPGDPAYLAASFEVDAGAQNNVSCGNVVDYDPATAGLAVILLTPSANTPTTHA